MAGSAAPLTRHAEPLQPGIWSGSARLPASQQTIQAESTVSPGSSVLANVVCISNIREAVVRLCRETRVQLAFVHSDFL